MSSLVYPGALHTRFSHALGAMYLTQQALNILRRKGIEITDDAYEGTLLAILLHDIGHGPFSHALEATLIAGAHHERISRAIMLKLDAELGGMLKTAIAIFEGTHPQKFLHELVSSQLDMDRMDYLMRDSFFTGVNEGVVSAERIIKVLNVSEGHLVVEHKGLYSLEKFIIARRLMYWQVYLHKAALAAENMLTGLLRRAKELVLNQAPIWCPANLKALFQAQETEANEPLSNELLSYFIALDDYDLHFCIKSWIQEKDTVLNEMAERLLNRRLLKLHFVSTPPTEEAIEALRRQYMDSHGYTPVEVPFFVFGGIAMNQAYLEGSSEPIRILYKDGSISDLTEASDLAKHTALTQVAVKSYITHPA